MRPVRTAVLLLACTACLCEVATAACPAQYNTSDYSAKPLVYGATHGACSSGCQPRDTIWSTICKLDPAAFTIWGVCEHWQRPRALELANQFSSGSIASFSPCDLYEAIGNSTLWVIGDSHTKGLWYSLRCFMMDLFDHQQGECAASSNATLQKQLELASLQGHPYNTPPRCLHMIGSRGRVCLVHNPIGNYLVSHDPQSTGTLQLLHQQFTAPDDIIYISIGRWHANNCEGIHPSYAQSLQDLAEYVQQESGGSLPQVVFGTAPHDHTKCDGKVYNQSVPACLPAAQGGYNLSMGYEMAAMAHSILGSRGIPVLDSYNVSFQLYDGHVQLQQSIAGALDCLHYCRPSLGELEVWKIFKAMEFSAALLKQQQQQQQADVPQVRECVAVQAVLPPPFGPTPRRAYVEQWVTDAWGYPYSTN